MSSDIHFQQLVSILLRRRRFIFTVAAAGTALAIIGGLAVPPRYTAKAQIVSDPQPGSGTDGHRAESASADDLSVRTDIAALMSDDNLRQVVASLATDSDIRAAALGHRPFLGRIAGDLWEQLSPLLADGDRIVEQVLGMHFFLTPSVGGPAPGDQILTLEDLKRQLRAYQEQASRVVSVTFTSTSPEIAAAVANRTADFYVQKLRAQDVATVGRSLAWFDERVAQAKRQLETAEAAIDEYRIAHGLPDPGRAGSLDQRVADLSHQLASLELDLATRQGRLAHIRGLQHSSASPEALVDALGSPALIDLRRQEIALLQSETELQKAFGDQYPKMQEIRGQLEQLNQELSREIGWSVANLQNETDILGAQARHIRQQLAALDAADADVHLHELEGEAGTSRQVYASLRQRQSEVRERAGTVTDRVRMLSVARMPDRPSSPNRLWFLLPALFVSSISGGLLALAAERLDQRLRSEHDVRTALGVPCLGIVPQLRRTRRDRPHQCILTKPFAAYTEAVRSLVAASQLTNAHPPPKTILITSSLPGEGKTTLAVSFAVCTALLGRRVLLVDLDFRHPTILRELGGNTDKGIFDLLVDGVRAEDVIQRIPGLMLDYLPLRYRSVDPLPLIATEKISHLIRDLSQMYDCVIIDSPPVLAVTEARLLPAIADKVLFVVKWGSTRRDIVRSALTILRNQGFFRRRASPLAAVITQVDLKKHALYRYGDVGETFANRANDRVEIQNAGIRPAAMALTDATKH